MRQDIYGGLKNALERGSSLEQAIQTFINAGYNSHEVKEAANALSPEAGSSLPVKSPSKKENPLTSHKLKKNESKKSSAGKIILLIAVLLILLSLLGATIFFREEAIELFTSLF